MSAYQLPVWVWPVALAGVCGIAIRRGGDEERLAAGGVVFCWALSLLVFKDRSQATQWPVLAIDLGLFGLYVFIALRSRRYWPLFAAAFQLLTLIPHVAHAIDPTVSGWAYWTAARTFSYLALITIGYAAWTAPHYAETVGEPRDVPGATRR